MDRENLNLNGSSPAQVIYESEEELDLSRWLDVLQRRWQLIGAVTGCVVVAALVLYVITPKLYRASTTIQIQRNNSSIVSMDQMLDFESYWDAQSFYPTQYKLLESRGLAERVVRNLGLANDPAFSPPRAERSTEATDSTAADDARRLGGLAAGIQGGLSIQPVRNTRLVEIAYSAPDPELAARIANGVADAYIDWGIETRSDTFGRASSFLASQIEGLKQEIQEKETQFQAYSRRTDIVALDPNSNVVVQRLEALNRDYTAAVSLRIDKEAKYNEVLNAPRETVAETYSEGLVAQLRRDVFELEQDYANNLETYKPEWPAMQELKAKINNSRANLQSVIDAMVEEAKKSARTEYQTALRRERSLSEELTRQKSAAMQLNSASVEYNNLRVEVSTRRQLLDELVRKQSETGVANRLQESRNTNVVIVDRALVPGGAYRPSLRRNLTLGFVLGFMLGLGGVVLLELLDRKVRTASDIDRNLGLPMLGLIPDTSEGASRLSYSQIQPTSRRGQLERWRSKLDGFRLGHGKSEIPTPSIELIPHLNTRSTAAEAYRTVRAAVLLSTAGGISSVVVTSANPGEGKTSTSLNLAVVLAQLGEDVLLIDSDLRKPRLHDVLMVSGSKGLVDHLTAEVDPAEIFVRTQVPNLYLTPAGPIPPNPSELLSSSAMHDFMTLAKQRFRYVIFDSPPLLAVSDATILGTLADGAILCVGSGLLDRNDGATALEQLSMGGVRILGAVLNLFPSHSDSYGGYGYGYGYGPGPSDPEQKEKPKSARRTSRAAL
ncbi:MAG: polysaccharide biosynthesis tyrosine autokinase [bacterium]|nr:polysaccharide biosynthesis tyrosine autokinase [bacterium]